MRKLRLPASPSLVTVQVVFTADELRGLDFMARELQLDRPRLVRRALNLAAVLGPDFAGSHGVNGALTEVCCGICGADW